MNNGNGWTNVSSSWQCPEPFISTGVDSGARLEDLNGDGLPDIIRSTDVSGVHKSVWINTGAGWVNSSDFVFNDYFTSTAKTDTGARFADANGDGLSDIIIDYVYNSTDTGGVWINNGTSFVNMTSQWLGIPPFTKNGNNVGRRLGDVNGDGFADIVTAYDNSSGTSDLYTYIKNSSTPYLLKRIVNEYGGVTEIDYTASTSKDNTLNGTSQLGFNMWIVNDYRKNNSLGGEFNNTGMFSYGYSGGKYDYQDKEFRGFAKVTETKPDNNYVTHYFLQDDALKGKEYKTEVYGSDEKLYSKSENNYNYTNNGYYIVNLKDSASYLYDGDSVPKVTAVSFAYDSYGNVVSKINYGENNVSGDEKYEYYFYAYNPPLWIIDRLSKYELYGADNLTLARKTQYEYDGRGISSTPIKGDLTKIKEWNNLGSDAFKRFEYDSYGNMVKSIDALGYETIYRYGLRDTTFTYPDKITNALNQYVDYRYDLGTGNLLWQEKEGIRTSYSYDVFGRITKEIQPLDDDNLPSKRYEYFMDGAAPEVIKTSQRESAGNYSDSYFYYDGNANAIQIKQLIENNKTVTKNIFYDAQDRVKYEQNPYFENYNFNISLPDTTVNKTFYIYDPLDRVAKVTNPDGTSKNTVFNKWTISDYDENSHQHDYLLDSYGRIKNVIEYNVQPLLNNKAETYNTSYYYDTNDNLIKIIDNENNEFKFYYDSLGRKIKLDDPDLGVWAYSYDANGNLIQQNNSKNNLIVLSYDPLNRIIYKNSTDVNISFSYDSQYWGTLSNLSMGNTIYRYTYDKRMRLTKLARFINGKQANKDLNYDSLNRLLQQVLPSGDLEYYYNKQGRVNKINNFVTASKYNSFGSILNRSYANGLVTQFNYTSSNNRLNRISTGNIQNLAYIYDNAGNILSLQDSVAGRNNSMSYDALDRLATTSINNDLYQYEYDSIGNIKRIVNGNSTKRLNYNGIIPHAPSQVVNYDNVSAGIYDAKDLDAGTKNRTFEFFLLKEKLSNLSNVLFSINFGIGNFNSNIPLNLSSAPILVIVENNYSNGGVYNVNISTSTDANIFADKFGVAAKSLNLIASDKSYSIMEFFIENTVHEKTGASWNCSNGIGSILPFNLTSSAMVIIEDNSTLPGNYKITCSVNSTDGSGNKSNEFTVKGLKIENYDLISIDTNRKVATYEVKNYYNPLLVNFSISSDTANLSQIANISPEGLVMAIIELNYSTDGNKQIDINAISSIANVSYRDNFKIAALQINNYDRYDFNNTNRIMMFDAMNKWPSNLSVGWNVTELNVTNSAYLNQSSFVMVIIEGNYSADGRKEPAVSVSSNSFLTTTKDRFNIFFVHLLDLQVLKNSISSTVAELTAKSHFGNNNASWRYDTGREIINSTGNVMLNETDEVSILIESNYTSAGIYPVNASINSSIYRDNAQAVVIT